MRDSGTSTWTRVGSTGEGGDVLPPSPLDALSAPTADSLFPSGRALWPRGAAWGTPDGAAPDQASVLSRFTLALLEPFALLYARVFDLTKESRALTIEASLTDWEIDFGLPDDCGSQDDSQAARRRALLSKVRSTATITPRDFISLAAQEGFRIEIEEPAAFECGFSECGGEHQLGNPREDVFWIVHVYDLAVDYFRVGESEVGHDALFQVVGAGRLGCLFDRLRPGWTRPLFVIHETGATP